MSEKRRVEHTPAQPEPNEPPVIDIMQLLKASVDKHAAEAAEAVLCDSRDADADALEDMAAVVRSGFALFTNEADALVRIAARLRAERPKP